MPLGCSATASRKSPRRPKSAVGAYPWTPRINLHDVTLEGGDAITVGLGIDKIITMDPGNYRDRDTETVIRNVFDALVTRTWDGEVIPEIAESWEIPDPTTYVFKIRGDHVPQR